MEAPHQKAAEERKRDAAYPTALRWRHLQETITWAEAQLPLHKRRNRPRRPVWLAQAQDRGAAA